MERLKYWGFFGTDHIERVQWLGAKFALYDFHAGRIRYDRRRVFKTW